VRHRIGFEHLTTVLQGRLEFVEQPGLSGAGLRHHRDDLPVPGICLFERALQLLKLAFAADERGETALSGDIKVAARCPGCDDLKNIDNSGDPFDFGGTQPTQLK
jgi:hypothetical protein